MEEKKLGYIKNYYYLCTMKLILHILKRAFQAGLAMAIFTLLYVFVGVEVVSLGYGSLFNIFIMLVTLLVFIFFGIVGTFAYFEYKSEFKPKIQTNEHN